MRTHCPAGYDYSAPGVTCYSGGRRSCLQCAKDRRAARATPKPTLADRLMVRFVPSPIGCWEWTGTMHREGYGALQHEQRKMLAHRAVYELLVGPIPDGMTLDHLCRNRACVNPLHLEPVTLAENVRRGESPPARNARKTHCPRGHSYDEGNTYITPSTGHRQCRTCIAARYADLRRQTEARRAGDAQ